MINNEGKGKEEKEWKWRKKDRRQVEKEGGEQVEEIKALPYLFY